MNPPPSPERYDLLVENATLPSGERATLGIAGGHIRRVHTGAAADATVPHEAAQRLDASGMLVSPAFYNAHTHAGMTLLRGFADDMPLMEWLQTRIWPAEGKLTPEAVYWATKLGCYEMIRTGTVGFNDMYWHLPQCVEAVKDSGMRAVLAPVFVKFLDLPFRKLAEEAHAAWKRGEWGEQIQFALAPHAPYTVEDDEWRWIAEFAREHKVPIHTHLSETETEVEEIQKASGGARPAEHLHTLGVFEGNNVIAAHCVWLDENEFALMAEHGALCCHCPSANMKLAVGGERARAFPYAMARQAGAKVALGTDGPCSNNNLDMLEEMKFAALLAKHATGNAALMPAAEALALGTRAFPQAVGLDAGRLEEGALADLVLMPLDDVMLTPSYDYTSHLVYAANGYAVDTVICGGKILMRNRQQPGYAEARAKVEEIVHGLGLKAS